MINIATLLSSLNVGISFVDTLLPIVSGVVDAVSGDSTLSQKASQAIQTASNAVTSISSLATVAEGLIEDGTVIATSSDVNQLNQVKAKLQARNDILADQINKLGA